MLPFGLTNAPATFMHLMHQTLPRRSSTTSCLVFLDDILIYSKTLEEHERHVRRVLETLREQKLYAKESKCEFFKHEVEFLGHIVGRDGVRMMEDKVKAVRAGPRREPSRDVRAFLGTAGYYRKFIRDFSAIAAPLSELTKDNVKFEWERRTSRRSVTLKAAIAQGPVLILPDPSLPFVVHTDASGFAVGAVLQQDQGKGLQPIAFLSKKMLDAETRYPVHEQELLAIIQALTAWRHYLHGSQVHRDDRSQVAAVLPDAAACCPDGKLAGRMCSRISTSTSSTWRAKPTSSLTDSPVDRTIISWQHWMVSSVPLNREKAAASSTWSAPGRTVRHSNRSGSSSWKLLQRRKTVTFALSAQGRLLADIKEAAQSDPIYRAALSSKQQDALGKLDPRLLVRRGLVYLGESDRLYVPADSALRTRLLHECHDAPTAGHFGKDKTIEQVKRRFYWPGMDKDILQYVRTAATPASATSRAASHRRACCSLCRFRIVRGSR